MNVLIILGQFGCLNDPLSYVGWSLVLLVGPSMLKRSKGRDQTKSDLLVLQVGCRANDPTFLKTLIDLHDACHLYTLLRTGRIKAMSGGFSGTNTSDKFFQYKKSQSSLTTENEQLFMLKRMRANFGWK